MWGGNELRSRRSDMNMTQVALARALGISHRMYCYYETGERDIPRSVELSLRYLARGDSGDEGTLESQGTLTAFDRDRLSRLCLALESHEGMDAETDKLLRQSLKEIDYLLSKFPE
tara:strand:- start:775 stop:1122 length:348 start_codon:yes stop_codon:yes gene_type:complete